MAYIKINIDHPIYDGMPLTFKAPCACSDTEGITVGTQNFVFRDAHGNTLTSTGELFSAGVLIKVILDVTNRFAYIQNADTNAYLENRFSTITVPASRVTTGFFDGWVATRNQYHNDSLLRNTRLVAIEMTPKENGEIYWQYE